MIEPEALDPDQQMTVGQVWAPRVISSEQKKKSAKNFGIVFKFNAYAAFKAMAEREEIQVSPQFLH